MIFTRTPSTRSFYFTIVSVGSQANFDVIYPISMKFDKIFQKLLIIALNLAIMMDVNIYLLEALLWH